MKKIIIIFISLFIFCSCDWTIPVTTPQEKDSVEIVETTYSKPMMMNTFEREFTKVQFDSICKADKISNDFSKWHMFISKDAETGQPFKEYMYIKSIGKDEAIYRVIQTGPITYKITKRIIKE